MTKNGETRGGDWVMSNLVLWYKYNMTIQELINLKNIRALLAVFFNLTDDDEKYFYVKSEYRESHFLPNAVNDPKFSGLNYQLSRFFGLKFESKSFGVHKLKISKTNDIDTAEKFLTEIYRQVQILIFDIETEEYEEAVLLSLFMLRGSPDFTAQYYAVDIYRKYSSKQYLRNIFQILSGTTAISQLNLNFREFQPQFAAGKNQRNTQIRIKLGWFWHRYGPKLIDLNHYKYSILRENATLISAPTLNIGNFSDRLVEYLNNVLGEKTDKYDIKRERDRLGLSASGTELRDYNLKTIANNIFPDECMGCKNVFSNEQRTFRLRNGNGYYFEIHHMIPFSKGKEHDQIDNLAKLCPVCHRVLTKNRAEEKLQKNTIQHILNNSVNVKGYVSILAQTKELSVLTDFVYSKLV